MQKNITSRLPAPRIRFKNQDIPAGLVYFTANAISSWIDCSGSSATNLEDCTWHEDLTSGVRLYIVTDIKI